MEKLERFRGALVGLAAGDALGTTIEFERPGHFEPVTDMIGGGPFNLKAGEWTDDTSMALCLAHSLVYARGFDPGDQMRRYVNWYRQGYMSVKGYCFDIGLTTQDALRRFEQTGEPYSGSTHPYSAGNGSLMRLAPVPMFFHQDFDEAVRYAQNSSMTTHGAQAAVDACGYYGGLIWAALNGYSKEEILSPFFSPISGYWQKNPLVPEIAAIAAGNYKEKEPPVITGEGYVVRTMEAALWAFYHTEDFASGALQVVNLGDDADTTGAVYGQLAGAWYGLAGIPASWREMIAMKEIILDLADQLTDHS